MRRIVTNFNQEGKSVFASEGKPQRIVTFESIPGFELNEIWATDSIPSLPVEKSDPTEKTESFVPNTGGTCFRIIRIPPEQDILKAVEAGLDMSNARQEYIDKAPGLGDSHEIENQGMHTTDTVDYIIVISGEVWLELDDGAETHLKQGGLRCAERNPACLEKPGIRAMYHSCCYDRCKSFVKQFSKLFCEQLKMIDY